VPVRAGSLIYSDIVNYNTKTYASDFLRFFFTAVEGSLSGSIT